MHILFVVEDTPLPGAHGSGILTWALVEYLIQSHHQVTVFLSPYLHDDIYADDRIQKLKGLGADVLIADVKNRVPVQKTLLNKLHAWFWPRLIEFYPEHLFLEEEIKRHLREINPDVILSFGFWSLAATRRIKNIPQMGIVGTWAHAFRYYYWCYQKHQSFFSRIKSGIVVFSWFREKKAMVNLLRGTKVGGHLAANHARWFQKHGVPHCRYYRSPIADVMKGQDPNDAREKIPTFRKPRIVMLGRMGTPMYLGLHTLVNHVLPELEKVLGADGFDLRLVGDLQLPPEFASQLNRPSITLTGFLDSIDEELLSASVLLVPTPEEISVRLRIITGLAYGCCIVTTAADAKAIPELVHEENALIAPDKYQISSLIVRVLRDGELRSHLQKSARRTFEKYFAQSVAASFLEFELKRAVAEFHFPEKKGIAVPVL